MDMKRTNTEMTAYGSTDTDITSLNPSTKDNDLEAVLKSYNNSTSSFSDGVTDRKEPLTLRRIAISLSLYANLIITLTKVYAYARTLSLSVLAALVDSVLDVVSQFVLDLTERHSTKIDRSSALYPAGAARLEPIGVLTCAALMGMASFEVLKQSVEQLVYEGRSLSDDTNDMGSFWSMVIIVFVKLLLLALCKYAAREKQLNGKWLTDHTLEALSQDHLNDGLSNAIAAVALLFALSAPSLWYLDPVGAILISVYIIYSWYTTAREQIEQLTGKAAPDDFLDELRELANNFDKRMVVDVCRAYHFGPKFLVELEVVMKKDTLLFESHDLGMELQYEIEGREEVERCFVHIDYEVREYDEHVVSKVPELRERIRKLGSGGASCHSV
mmetsp:Transcript_9087/g.11183  ORF Transcript_9087/g.11183 Transcript_9087/m.11183 type:complete len:386 (-) Transcript_9087:207-1364(-)|eukprot:CAMPEP_0172513316 /NCGR_PEP_ID=MMETSP1066-20121228/251623_1 /TAXON_ID=671091 /ORGANISM="Coscinodiscus wailesii, Strain CCMP2513" /LENGTH=385 /DNA_ID=CAMNT_0013293521 /DNA_START=93 /DNA_END=1250 /DNA_ORIENTATION=+